MGRSTFGSLALVISLVSSSSVAEEPPSGPQGGEGQWALVFNDQFDGNRLDLKKWTTCYWWNKDGCTNLGNNELQWYRPENVSVAGGLLRLEARPRKVRGHKNATFNYTSGMVTTGRDYDELPNPSRARFLYGHFEIRAKAPVGQGLWSAIWLLPESRESRPEIDVMEVLGHTPDQLRMHFHYVTDKGERQSPGETVKTADLTAEWHLYGLSWEPGLIVWYLDGVEKWRFSDKGLVPNEEMYLLINLAVGGDWPGPPDETTKFPAEYLIDYVRVWQRVEG